MKALYKKYVLSKITIITVDQTKTNYIHFKVNFI